MFVSFFLQVYDGIRHSSVSGFQFFVFFFQAEDGIRDSSVTGVQTCAPPLRPPPCRRRAGASRALAQAPLPQCCPCARLCLVRSCCLLTTGTPTYVLPFRGLRPLPGRR